MSSLAISLWFAIPVLYVLLGALNAKAYFMLMPQHYTYENIYRVMKTNYVLIIILAFLWPISFLLTTVNAITRFAKPELNK